MKRIICLFSLVVFFASCSNDNTDTDKTVDATANPAPPVINYSVVNVYPHDTASFTEGLLVSDGQLYESTGSPNETNFKSWFGPVDLKTGKAIKKVMLDPTYFGEGITILNGKLYQLTWQNHIGFVYDAKTFAKIKDFSYSGDGWSLTNDGTNIIMSDGTNKLQYLDPETLKVLKIVGVEDNNGPVPNINELEYINGYIYSNQWQTNYILKIDPASGKVVGRCDLSTLENEVKIKYPRADVLNGIAYDASSKKIYVTGKNWPNLYEIRMN